MVGRSSNGHSSQVRDVVYERSFELMAQSLRMDTRTLDEKLEGLIFTIARIPELFPAMYTNDEGELLHAAVYEGQPPLVVWFTFDANTVRLRFITRALPEEDGD